MIHKEVKNKRTTVLMGELQEENFRAAFCRAVVRRKGEFVRCVITQPETCIGKKVFPAQVCELYLMEEVALLRDFCDAILVAAEEQKHKAETAELSKGAKK